MLPRYSRTGIGKAHIFHITSWIVAGIVSLQSLPAADAWSRVARLKVESAWVFVSLTDGKYIEGRFLGSDSSGMIVRTTTDQGEVTIARDLVLQVAVPHNGRRWYSIPLTAVVAGAGALAGYKTARHLSCSNVSSTFRKDCEKLNGYIVAGITIAPAVGTYYLTLGPSKKVIYDESSEKARSRRPATIQRK
jgi:hypothetical protein